MNNAQLRLAAKNSLRQASPSPVLMTFLFFLCAHGLVLLFNCFDLLYSNQINSQTGFDALHTVGLYSSVGTILSTVINLSYYIWTVGYENYALTVSRNQESGFFSFLAPFRWFFKVLGLQLFVGLRVLLYAIPGLFLLLYLTSFGALSLLAVPVILVPVLMAYYRYRFAVFALLDDPTHSILRATLVSQTLTYGSRKQLFKLDLSFFYYYILMIAAQLPLSVYDSLELLELLPAKYQSDLNFILVQAVSAVLVIAVNTFLFARKQTAFACAYNDRLSAGEAPQNRQTQIPPAQDPYGQR